MISDKLINMKAIYSILALLVIGCDDPNRCEEVKQYAESPEANIILLKKLNTNLKTISLLELILVQKEILCSSCPLGGL